MINQVRPAINNENAGLSSININNNDVPEGSMPTEKIKHVSTWSIVHFESDEEDCVDGFNNLIPSSWITIQGSLCWYPMNEHKSTIQKLVKQCATVNVEWNCFAIKKIEEGIENYDRGMKMLIKLAKNPNASLHSDLEEKGKGKRLKKTTNRFIASDKENTHKRYRKEQALPPIPKLSLPDPKNAATDNQSHERQALISLNNGVPQEPSKEKKSANESITEQSKFTRTNSRMDRNEETVQKNRCKMPLKIKHKCAYAEDGEATLHSVADAICYLSAEVTSCKLMLRKTDKNVESFMEVAQETPKRPKTVCDQFFISILNKFPLKNVEDLHVMERKLKQDVTFKSELVNALHLQVAGESDKKQVTSILRMVLHDNLASCFNWKGQRGDKKKMANRRIVKMMIGKIVFSHS